MSTWLPLSEDTERELRAFNERFEECEEPGCRTETLDGGRCSQHEAQRTLAEWGEA